MPSRTRRRRWQDVDKEYVRLDSVLQLYLMSFTRLSRSSGRPTTRLRHDYWYSDGDYDIRFENTGSGCSQSIPRTPPGSGTS
jgi:hypothetical protein